MFFPVNKPHVQIQTNNMSVSVALSSKLIGSCWRRKSLRAPQKHVVSSSGTISCVGHWSVSSWIWWTQKKKLILDGVHLSLLMRIWYDRKHLEKEMWYEPADDDQYATYDKRMIPRSVSAPAVRLSAVNCVNKVVLMRIYEFLQVGQWTLVLPREVDQRSLSCLR